MPNVQARASRGNSPIQAPPETWQKWLDICDAISADDVELVVEEFAPFSELFNLLFARGVPFDRSFVLRVRELQASMVNTDDDADLDHQDDGLCDGTHLDAWRWNRYQIGRPTL